MNDQPPIMVLVTLQRHCAKLIRYGTDKALKQGSPLKVVHVTQTNEEMADEKVSNADVLNYLYALANEAGAEMCMINADVAVTAMAEYAKEIGTRQIIMGDGEQAHGIAETLSSLLPGVSIGIIGEEAE